ncbi:hypothetical protein Taro_047829 [Colocasia esculenta]|uniref:FLZ-type domain-containing protein n=1 Tax=Colocasia esculenta TaxID=4460 RepID=A0A843X1L3_COLES|nr:hypothetical protein [Colocasia esculenta]
MEGSRAVEGGSATLSSPQGGALRRRASYRALGSLSPRSGGVAFPREAWCAEEHPRHFLDACALCRRPLSRYRDIFMYRGDTPFCSEECRQEQIELDEAREEEEASYWRSRRRNHRSGHRVRDPAAAAAADVQGVRARAPETAVAG